MDEHYFYLRKGAKMKEKLEQIKENSLRKINESKTINELQEVMKELTSKKSELTEIMKTLGSLSPEERKEIGMITTEIKRVVADANKLKEEELISLQSVLDSPIDLTLPGLEVSSGVLHPITQMCYDLMMHSHLLALKYLVKMISVVKSMHLII